MNATPVTSGKEEWQEIFGSSDIDAVVASILQTHAIGKWCKVGILDFRYQY